MKFCKAMNSHLLELTSLLWTSLMADLRVRGGNIRESGAFLLGDVVTGTRHVRAWIPYDQLDLGALERGYVHVSTAAFTKLWSRCAEVGMVVVGDIHTHPYGPVQSHSDRSNPMISQAGHIALIVPRYAKGKVTPSDVSLNVYRGAKEWSSFHGLNAHQRIRLI